MRIYEFSKNIGVSSKELIDVLKQHGFDVASHMSVLTDEAIEFLQKKYDQSKKTTPSNKQVENTITMHPQEPLKNIPPQPLEAQAATKEPAPSAPDKFIKKAEPAAEKNITQPGVIVEPMTVMQLSQKIDKPINEVMLNLLKQGTLTTKNQLLPVKAIEALLRHYQIPILASVQKSKEEIKHVSSTVFSEKNLTKRLPIIVVIGHVDHGKTTLLDFIRKTKVAAREEGGITQHLGAYHVKTSQGGLIFLDTPGHAAFIKMRARGVKVADIAVLVVAADDGIMPQTVEAIKHAKNLKVPLIVAINKIDKASLVQIEAVKRGLSQYDLLPEEWGGQTIVVPISAKSGQGVDQLLEMIQLQSELMELQTDPTVAGKGFVLEARVEKGRGSVATVIAQEGTIKVGDFFVAGSVVGKVSSIIDSYGHKLKEVGPSIPVQLAGFDQIPEAGNYFEVVDQDRYAKARASKTTPLDDVKKFASDGAIKIMIKTDTKSSKEALVESITQLSNKSPKKFQIIYAGVGDISESDVELALTTQSLIYGFHVKFELNASALAQKEDVSVRQFQIIYKLLDDLELMAKEQEVVKMVSTKIGEATVKKVFEIKNVGTIAGAYVNSGRLARNGKLVIWRGKTKLADAPIKSLERDRKTVKEVHTGFECAFLAEGFNDWSIDDRVECFVDMPAK